MPKLKTNKGAQKRFKVSKKGRIKFRRALRNHGMCKQTTKLKRHLRGKATLKDCDKISAERLLNIN